MKRFARILTLMTAAVMLSGLAMAQDEDDQSAADLSVPQTQEPQFPLVAPSPAPSPSPQIQVPTGIPIGPGTLAPTFNPPGVKYTIPIQ